MVEQFEKKVLKSKFENFKELKVLKGHKENVYSVVPLPGGETIASVSIDEVKIWNLKTGKSTSILDLKFNPKDQIINSAIFSPDGKIMASVFAQKDGHSEDIIKLWDTESGDEIRSLEGHETSVNSVAFSPDGKKIISSGEDETIRFWDFKTGKNITTSDEHPDCDSIYPSPDGKTLVVTGSDDGIARFLNVETMEEIGDLWDCGSGISSVAFSPDGKTMVSDNRSSNRYDYKDPVNIKIWNVETKKELRTLRGHKEPVLSVAFSPDGKTVVSGGRDKTIRIWNAETGENIKTLKAEGIVSSVAFSRDGEQIISSGEDKNITIWGNKK